MPETRYLVLMRPEGALKPQFVQETMRPDDTAWEDVAVDAVDLALRGAESHFEVACGYRFDPVKHIWVECGFGSIDVDIADAASEGTAFVAHGGSLAMVVTQQSGKPEVRLAMQHLLGDRVGMLNKVSSPKRRRLFLDSILHQAVGSQDAAAP